VILGVAGVYTANTPVKCMAYYLRPKMAEANYFGASYWQVAYLPQ